jgi:hypothetical protein
MSSKAETKVAPLLREDWDFSSLPKEEYVAVKPRRPDVPFCESCRLIGGGMTPLRANY